MIQARAIAFGLLFTVIVLAADAGLLGFVRGLHEIPLADKLGHFVLYGMLSLLVTLAVFHDQPNWDKHRVVAVCAGLLTLVAGLEEWTQLYISSRTFSPWDLEAGIAGITMGALFVLMSAARSNTPQPSDQG